MKNETWRTLAIIFMVLFIIESVFFIWVWSLGTEMIENEETCSYEVCAESETYFFDDIESYCYCFDGEELVKEKQM